MNFSDPDSALTRLKNLSPLDRRRVWDEIITMFLEAERTANVEAEPPPQKRKRRRKLPKGFKVIEGGAKLKGACNL